MLKYHRDMSYFGTETCKEMVAKKAMDKTALASHTIIEGKLDIEGAFMSKFDQ